MLYNQVKIAKRHIPIRYLRGGVERHASVDVSGTRRNFLENLAGN